VIIAGAGMGVDSGLPDFRGKDGKWGRVEGETGKSVLDVMNPRLFESDLKYAWKLFGSRIQFYQETIPHSGFSVLKNWIARYHLDYFVLTSNVDGQFQKAGFDEERIREVHGSIHYFQGLYQGKCKKVWENERTGIEILQRAGDGIFPTCPVTDIPARPNVYMFRDGSYNSARSKSQDKKYRDFLAHQKNSRILVFEIGSGPHVQTLRMKTRELRRDYNAHIVRINPDHASIKPPHIGIATAARKALLEIDSHLKSD